MTQDKLACPACGKKLGSKSALTAHVRKEHGGDSLIQLMAKYGDQAPRPGGAWRPDRPLRAAPSGVPSIDYAIGIGGVPRGTIIEIFGPAGCGKTLTALTFSAYAQRRGGMAGYIDAEHRLQPTFARLCPGLDLDTLYYAAPRGGELALNQSKDFISTGLYDVWTVDSVHALTPEAMREKPIGSDTIAEVAKLMSVGCQVLDAIIADTNTVCIFVNHMKSKPAVQYGRDWFKPGGSALDYYASVQLRVRPMAVYQNAEGRKVGHTIKVTVENSKVSAPFATAEYDIFYKHDKIKKKDDPKDGLVVQPGIDMGSCWFSVCEEAGLVRAADDHWYDTESGESYGSKRDTVAMLEEDCELRRKADNLIYAAYADKAPDVRGNGKRQAA